MGFRYDEFRYNEQENFRSTCSLYRRSTLPQLKNFFFKFTLILFITTHIIQMSQKTTSHNHQYKKKANSKNQCARNL
ncbi:hypothetical protein BpHYR1_052749 [Brachionus plicatilis]|uniref:Uncharacterized protein n=1 Tax=Brachionus plicatilis TaxID=10195 RepID=A0A3M7R994_BRAPC|nr:hypothetical protein BpHYR1_052749 [Brachionus plicatilis]